MKASSITPKIIDLSKRIAEKWRMEIYPGAWYCYTNYVDENQLNIYPLNEIYPMPEYDRITPIPSIEDVLEKLRGLGWCIELYWVMEAVVDLVYMKAGEPHRRVKTRSDNLHEALLEALLEALEEKEAGSE